MKYVATVEIEYEFQPSFFVGVDKVRKSTPLETLKIIMNRTGWKLKGLSHWVRKTGDGPYAEHYHIVEQPREM